MGRFLLIGRNLAGPMTPTSSSISLACAAIERSCIGVVGSLGMQRKQRALVVALALVLLGLGAWMLLDDPVDDLGPPG